LALEKDGHLEKMMAEKEINLLVYILSIYLLNNSLNTQLVDNLAHFLADNLNEQDLLSMSESRLGNLNRSLKLLNRQRLGVD
jgi:hypothetical protein